MAQRLAQLLYTQLVGGSNPSSPTNYPRHGSRPDSSSCFTRHAFPLHMRLHLRGTGFADWPASLDCLAIAATIAFFSHLAGSELAVARWQVALGLTTLTVAIGAAFPTARSSCVRGVLGWFTPLLPIRSALGTVIDSEAERARVGREFEYDFKGVDTSTLPTYLTTVELEDGTCHTCVLPAQEWAKLQIGTPVRLVWQGPWLRSIGPSAESAAGPGTEL